MHCPECGAPVSENDLFCGACGIILSAGVGTGQVAVPAVEVLPSVERDSRANVSFILGLISLGLALAYCIPIVSIVSCTQPLVAVAAIVVGSMARRDIEAKGGLDSDRRRAQQGMILGIVAVVLYFILFILGLLLGVGLGILSEFD